MEIVKGEKSTIEAQDFWVMQYSSSCWNSWEKFRKYGKRSSVSANIFPAQKKHTLLKNQTSMRNREHFTKGNKVRAEEDKQKNAVEQGEEKC